MTQAEAYVAYAQAVSEDAKQRGTIPHCDSRILHEPAECMTCAERPNLLRRRFELGISFTGHNDDRFPCPAQAARPDLDPDSCWHGNMRDTEESRAEMRKQAEEMGRIFEEVYGKNPPPGFTRSP